MTGKISVELTTTLNCVDADKTVIWSLMCRGIVSVGPFNTVMSRCLEIFLNWLPLIRFDLIRSVCDIQQEAETRHGFEMIIQRQSKRERKNWQNEGLNHLFMLVKFTGGSRSCTDATLFWWFNSNLCSWVLVSRLKHKALPYCRTLQSKWPAAVVDFNCQSYCVLINEFPVAICDYGGFENRFSHDANQIQMR